jgi:hypothetical protein
MRCWYRILPCLALHYNAATVGGEMNGRQRLVAEIAATAIMGGLGSIGSKSFGRLHHSGRFTGCLIVEVARIIS